ncbi:MAG: hypothetical protein NUW37_13370 [Planctomycetes bacterium]|nr:hypothetical protein [Planctomycetota bacterium]
MPQNEQLFGQIAVKLGLTRSDALEKALKDQNDRSGQSYRLPVGEILVSAGAMQKADIKKVLHHQNFYKNRREGEKLLRTAEALGFIDADQSKDVLAKQMSIFEASGEVRRASDLLSEAHALNSRQMMQVFAAMEDPSQLTKGTSDGPGAGGSNSGLRAQNEIGIVTVDGDPGQRNVVDASAPLKDRAASSTTLASIAPGATIQQEYERQGLRLGTVVFVVLLFASVGANVVLYLDNRQYEGIVPARYNEAIQQSESMQSDLADAQKENLDLKNRVSTLESGRTTTDARITELNGLLTAANREKEQIRTQLQTAQRNASQLQNQVNQLTAQANRQPASTTTPQTQNTNPPQAQAQPQALRVPVDVVYSVPEGTERDLNREISHRNAVASYNEETRLIDFTMSVIVNDSANLRNPTVEIFAVYSSGEELINTVYIRDYSAEGENVDEDLFVREQPQRLKVVFKDQ